MSAPALVAGMLGNLRRGRDTFAAVFLKTGRGGRLEFAIYASHSDRILFGAKSRVGRVVAVRSAFTPLDLKHQPEDVQMVLAARASWAGAPDRLPDAEGSQ